MSFKNAQFDFLGWGQEGKCLITLFSSQPPELFIFKRFALEPHDSGNKLFVVSFDMDLFQPLCLQIST